MKVSKLLTPSKFLKHSVLVIVLGPEGNTQMNKTKFSVKKFRVLYLCAQICVFENLSAILSQPTQISSMLEIISVTFYSQLKFPFIIIRYWYVSCEWWIGLTLCS